MPDSLLKDKQNKVDVLIDANFQIKERDQFVRNYEKVRGEKYKQYRTKWHKNPKNQIVGSSPIHVDIETTTHCNLKCTMCLRTIMNKKGEWDSKHMSWDIYKNIIDQAEDLGVSSIKLNYYGEPLLHPDVMKQVRYAKDHGIVEVMMNTNAVLLTEQKSQELLDAGIDSLFFSFDSPYKEQYEKIRVGATYEKTIENIRTFSRLARSGKYDHVYTRISMVLMEQNKKQYEDFVVLWKDYLDDVTFSYYFNHIQRKEGIFGELFKEKGSRRDNFACPQIWQRLFVRTNGKMQPCCCDASNRFLLGNFIEGISLKEAWNSEKINRLRDLHANGESDQEAMCRVCSMRYF